MISIIIPIYNVEPYVEKCLQSVASQTYEGEMECLLIDDCGTDGSMDIVQQFVAGYEGPIQFRILHHDRNRGLSAARNTGMDNAKGNWIYFLDSDDWIIPECLALMHECIERHPDTDAVFAGTNVINGEHEWADYENRYLPEYSTDLWWINTTLLKRNVLGMTAWNKLFRYELIEKNHLRFIEGLKHEDEIWNMQLSGILQSLCTIPYNTYNYIKRADSITTNEVSDTNAFYYHAYIRNVMTNLIKGEKWQRQNQVKSIASWLINTSFIHWPNIRYTTMPFLLTKLALKTRSKLSIYLIVQVFLALIRHPYYRNKWILKVIKL